MSVPNQSSSILIIGAGTWGCSTALHLARRGYKHVSVLDPHSVPSPIAAGNDINKIMEHTEPKAPDHSFPQSIAFSTFSRAALTAWRNDPVFQPYFHETGAIISANTQELINHVQETEIDTSATDYVTLDSAEDFRRTMPEGVLTGEFPGWKGWWNRSGAGWIHARKAMVSAHDEAKRLGVVFLTGSPEGNVISLVCEAGDIFGAITADGKIHRAEYTILAAGAGSDRLIDFKNQLRPTAWTLCHIPMTAEEAGLYRNLPVLFNIAKGFFMEPDEDKHEMKICDEHPGYVNWVSDPAEPEKGRSIPFAKHQVPLEAETRAREFLSDTMPHLAERKLAFARICWDADTPDRSFLIDRHPEFRSLLVAGGGSGNGAMQMPSIGGFIVDALEEKLSGELKGVVRWRPETAVSRDWMDTQDRFGGRGRVMDFQNVGNEEWTDIKSR